jgi:TRAP-type C4-dicarboxylate transport system permease small subunit
MLEHLVPVALAAAQDFDIKPGGQFTSLVTITLPGIVQTAIRLVLVVAAIVAFFFLVLGGIKWVTSGGDKEQTQKAQGQITAALVGLVIVFAAWAILRLIEAFFGIKIFDLTIPEIPKTPY